MRIISGNYKGRLIQMPRNIRPTQQKVRKAIFDILGDIEGLSFLELFAGSAAVGFEAASRGASEVVLIEQNADCAMAIRKNIESLKECAFSFYAQDAERAVKMLHSNGKKFDIVFLDPPYYKDKRGSVLLSASTPGANRNCAGVPLSEATPRANRNCAGVLLSEAKKTLQILGAHDILNRFGIIIAQHFKKDALPAALGVLHLFRQSKYGDTLLSFYRKEVIALLRLTL